MSLIQQWVTGDTLRHRRYTQVTGSAARSRLSETQVTPDPSHPHIDPSPNPVTYAVTRFSTCTFARHLPKRNTTTSLPSSRCFPCSASGRPPHGRQSAAHADRAEHRRAATLKVPCISLLHEAAQHISRVWTRAHRIGKVAALRQPARKRTEALQLR